MSSPTWACVAVPALPLQLLLRQHPDWAGLPVVVVDEDRPQGTILWASEPALRARVFPGRRYAAGLSLAAGLRAGTVSAEAIAAALAEITAVLRACTPEVEPSQDEPGVLWLGIKGLDGRFRPAALAENLRARGLAASIAVGFTRFGTYALARSQRGVQVLASPEQERARADPVRLHRLGLEPGLRDALERLGVTTVGAFRALPAQALCARYGAAALRWHRLAHDCLHAPLASAPEPMPTVAACLLDPEQHGVDTAALLFLLGPRIEQLLATAGGAGKAIAALRLRLLLEDRPPREEEVRPAAPTLDAPQLRELLRLRLHALTLDAEIVGFELHATLAAVSRTQRELFAASRRDLAAGNRALARLRAELGDDAVVHAVLRDGHLPRARFALARLAALRLPAPGEAREPRVVRRIFAAPRVLASAGEDGAMVHGLRRGPLRQLHGPYVVSGGWWQSEQQREYSFAETRRGDVLWIYRDRVRRLWCLEGEVE